MDTINVSGLGYIGLPTAGIFATHGYRVNGVDVNGKVVSQLNQGDIHLQEPGLKTLVQAGLKSGNLTIKDKPCRADAFIIAVPTPITANKQADLSYVKIAAEAIVPYLQPGNLVILESTVPPGTTNNVLGLILSKSGLNPRQDLLVAHSPERVLPGHILTELVSNDRIIGGLTPEAAKAARDLYASFVQGAIHLTDAVTAEMVKLMENTYRDVNIALANEFALVAEAIGVDVWQAIEFANRHPRVNILSPGPGVGGHCIAVDPWFLVQAAPGPAQLIAAARRLNNRMPEYVVEKVRTILAKIDNPQIAILGLAYKANVDDIRESPALTVMRWLQATGCQVRAYDPYVKHHNIAGKADSLIEAATDADCLLFLTDHRQFKSISPVQMGNLMRHKIIVDTRNSVPHTRWQKAGFDVYQLGNGTFDACISQKMDLIE